MKIFKLKSGEEVIGGIKNFCQRNAIQSGWVNAIGAIKNVTLAHFDPATKKYSEKTINEQMEVGSIIGTISTCRDKIHFHLHAVLANNQFNTFSGHLKSAIVSPTLEITIFPYSKNLTRSLDKKIGLDILN